MLLRTGQLEAVSQLPSAFLTCEGRKSSLPPVMSASIAKCPSFLCLPSQGKCSSGPFTMKVPLEPLPPRMPASSQSSTSSPTTSGM